MTLPWDTLLEHCPGTLSCDISLGHRLRTQNWDTVLGHCPGTLPWDLGHFLVTLYWHTSLWRKLGTQHWGTVFGHCLGTLPWDSFFVTLPCDTYCLGTLSWDTVLGHCFETRPRDNSLAHNLRMQIWDADLEPSIEALCWVIALWQ